MVMAVDFGFVPDDEDIRRRRHCHLGLPRAGGPARPRNRGLLPPTLLLAADPTELPGQWVDHGMSTWFAHTNQADPGRWPAGCSRPAAPEPGTRDRVHGRRRAGKIVAASLGWSEAYAARRLEFARQVLERLPALGQAMASGALEEYKAGIFTGTLAELATAQARTVVERCCRSHPGWRSSPCGSGSRPRPRPSTPPGPKPGAPPRSPTAGSRSAPPPPAPRSSAGSICPRSPPRTPTTASSPSPRLVARRLRRAGMDAPIGPIRSEVMLTLTGPAGAGMWDRDVIDHVVERFGGPVSDDPDGDGSDGDNPDGDGPDGNGPDGNGPDESDDTGPDDPAPTNVRPTPALRATSMPLATPAPSTTTDLTMASRTSPVSTPPSAAPLVPRSRRGGCRSCPASRCASDCEPCSASTAAPAHCPAAASSPTPSPSPWPGTAPTAPSGLLLYDPNWCPRARPDPPPVPPWRTTPARRPTSTPRRRAHRLHPRTRYPRGRRARRRAARPRRRSTPAAGSCSAATPSACSTGLPRRWPPPAPGRSRSTPPTPRPKSATATRAPPFAPGCRPATRPAAPRAAPPTPPPATSTTPWPITDGGVTRADDLGPCCRRDHTFKHHPDSGWTVDQSSPGRFAWTAPTGRVHIQRARALRPPARPRPPHRPRPRRATRHVLRPASDPATREPSPQQTRLPHPGRDRHRRTPPTTHPRSHRSRQTPTPSTGTGTHRRPLPGRTALLTPGPRGPGRARTQPTSRAVRPDARIRRRASHRSGRA